MTVGSHTSYESAGSRTIIFGPIAALAGIFVLTWVVALANRLYGFTSPYTVLGVGMALFGTTAAISTYFGMRHLRKVDLLSRSDSLTLLPNRRALHSDIQEEFRQGHEVALAMIDLDGFKLTNDHYGHFVGDAAIRECANIFRQTSDGEARIYRLGGDEYAMMIGGPVSGTLLEGLSRRIIERLSKPIHVEDRRLTLGASIGLARRVPQDDVTSSELLRRADVAMYASKRGGKMRCTWFNPAFDQSREQLREMDDELRSALANNEFRLNYQPLVDSRTRMVVSVECLMRWDRPDGKRVGPNIFIPVAEESGLINPIGLWVLRKACCDALDWSDIALSVNISAAQLRNPEFPVQLGHILEETGFPPERLELEITETCLVLDPVVAERSLAVIRGFGVRVALDDFGTGYASFGFLRQFRFEKLKIDRSLVVQASQDDGSRAMMLSSITVARAMKMGVTAEGVETEEQADMVRAAGCDQIQGWLYFKAMPAEEIAQHLGKPISLPNAASSRNSIVA
ncbi:putative bifunctional diguanylate cyclase/phosphodiesterase [Qipengyuania qiaonensis]|uniref:Bifunctional diguanylate cyclase/phosphodiesterase n=1 Tax=Qipengyuania qiaonensis TaxID=2867240 RepID=A0ABS7J8M5_9SPHN|nr:bifunctional diguanylate cyclase/phosphodiesterase [Qipengyuania qiaonensis]MBX7483606.1 bifunctional diguanylate cyclase/phosphodiesterase [Qipengyuania qiaonensis]